MGHLGGHMAGKLINLQKVWYSPDRPPLPLAHFSFEGLDLKFNCKRQDTWNKLNVLWSANGCDTCVVGSVTLQLYRNRKNQIKEALSLFSSSEYDGERWGVFVGFEGILQECFEGNEQDFWVVNTSTRTFPCFHILKFPWPINFREGDMISGTGEIKKSTLKIPGEAEARPHTYVEVSHVVD